MGYKQYCKEPEKIENYEKAKADNFKGWECHHRLETHTPDGIRREVDISYKELKALGMYYNRPASELIFLTTSEHYAIRKVSDETRRRIGAASKGNKYALGCKRSEETKKKMSEAHKEKKMSEETRNKMSKAGKGKNIGNTNTKGMHWYNNGKESKLCYECPDGFVPGRIKKL